MKRLKYFRSYVYGKVVRLTIPVKARIRSWKRFKNFMRAGVSFFKPISL